MENTLKLPANPEVLLLAVLSNLAQYLLEAESGPASQIQWPLLFYMAPSSILVLESHSGQ